MADDRPMHYWRAWAPDLESGLLCVLTGYVSIEEIEGAYVRPGVCVTIARDLVTCQQCLEILHS